MDGSIYGVPMGLAKAALEIGETPEEKADAFNLIANIADEEMTAEMIVDHIINGTLPKYVEPKK